MHKALQLLVTPSVLAMASVFLLTDQVRGDEVAYSKKELQEIYTSYLKEEGYQPRIDRDGDVQFKIEGRGYYISVDERDPQFFRIVYPHFWEVEDLVERQRVLVAAHHSTMTTKCSKVFMVKDHVTASFEIFVNSPEDFRPVFKRSLSALRAGVDNFVAKMRE